MNAQTLDRVWPRGNLSGLFIAVGFLAARRISGTAASRRVVFSFSAFRPMSVIAPHWRARRMLNDQDQYSNKSNQRRAERAAAAKAAKLASLEGAEAVVAGAKVAAVAKAERRKAAPKP